MDFLVDNNVHILFVTETWLTDQNNHTTALIKEHGYKIYHHFRKEKTGGGVAVIYKASLKLVRVFHNQSELFESISVKVKLQDGTSVLTSCLYRPPGSMRHFLSDFEEFIADIFTRFEKIIICGDLNIHLDKISAHSTEFQNIISSYGLNQLVASATHKAGHILDPVISSHKMVSKASVEVWDYVRHLFPSCDHFPVVFSLVPAIDVNKMEKKITFRNLKSIDTNQFNNDLSDTLSKVFSFEHAENPQPPFEDIISMFNTECESLLNHHAPQISKVIKEVATAPWFDTQYRLARCERRRAEKQWKRTRLDIDHSIFVHLRKHCNELADQKKIEFFRSTFVKYSHSQKSLYNFVDTFLDKSQELTLPPADCLQETVNSFNTFFTEKIDKIRSSFQTTTNCPDPDLVNEAAKLTEFRPTDIEEIRSILKDSGIKTSSIDPLPQELISDNIEAMLPALCDLVNISLSSGNIDGAKLAHLTPLIKGQSLDNNNLKNYRPISNLTFVGKLIERVVLSRLNDHLKANNLNINHQSGYKKDHSTETLLIRIVDDLLIASSEDKATVVMLLDLSAAFDTVDHQKLIQILKWEIGIDGNALKWFKSFITGRCQKVKIGESESMEIVIRFGVPQGSVLGPVLFNIYIRSIYSTVQSKSFTIHGFADDHQIYKSFPVDKEYQIMVEDLPACFQAIERWMNRHYLQLNPGKTEIMVFGSTSVLSTLELQGVFITSTICVKLVPTAKNLGFVLNSSLTLDPQIKKLKSVCCHKFRNITKMKPFLTETQMKILVQSLVISSLDYCNALYYGISSTLMRQLQSIQNRACRIIKGLKKRENVTEHLKELHWLKVQERIEFKLLLLVFKSLNGRAPGYLSELLCYTNISGSRVPSLQYSNSKSDRAFSVCAPKLWNELPLDIKQCSDVELFKQKLKTHLFKKSYDINVSV